MAAPHLSTLPLISILGRELGQVPASAEEPRPYQLSPSPVCNILGTSVCLEDAVFVQSKVLGAGPDI